MSTRYNNGSHYENHQRAAELHDLAAHAHRTGEHQGKEEHLSAHEHSQQALEHSEQAHQMTQSMAGHGGHDEIAALAHALWQARGCPEGSPQVDWIRAAEQLRSRSSSH
jgi:DUF2934 family protein